MSKQHKEWTPVESVEHLKDILSDGATHEFFIQLAMCRSWKNISYCKEQDRFYILHDANGRKQSLKSKNFTNPRFTNFGEAIKKGALVYAW